MSITTTTNLSFIPSSDDAELTTQPAQPPFSYLECHMTTRAPGVPAGLVHLSSPTGLYSGATYVARRPQSTSMWVPAKRLLHSAMVSMREICIAHPVTGAAAKSAVHVAKKLTFDNAPTPQVAYGDDGGIDIEWLVDGISLNVSCYGDGEVFLWAVDNDGGELFEAEYVNGQAMSGEEYGRAVELLKQLAAEVTSRAALAFLV